MIQDLREQLVDGQAHASFYCRNSTIFWRTIVACGIIGVMFQKLFQHESGFALLASPQMDLGEKKLGVREVRRIERPRALQVLHGGIELPEFEVASCRAASWPARRRGASAWRERSPPTLHPVCARSPARRPDSPAVRRPSGPASVPVGNAARPARNGASDTRWCPAYSMRWRTAAPPPRRAPDVSPRLPRRASPGRVAHPRSRESRARGW